MNPTQKIAKEYDYVLVGYNLTSLAFSNQLKTTGHSFCIVDSKQITNHKLKFITPIDDYVFTRVPFNSYNEDILENDSLSEYRSQLGVAHIDNSPPTTFEKGEFKSFLGFGEFKVEAAEQWSLFCQPNSIQYENQPEKIWLQLQNNVEESLFLDQQLTGIQCENDVIQELVLNGKTKVRASQFVFFEQLPYLFSVIGQNTKNLASKVGKVKWWSSACLLMVHSKAPAHSQFGQTYLLKGAKEQPCLGQFQKFGEKVISRWECLFPSELIHSAETTGSAIKEIKKQFKRAFPFEPENKPKEHIFVHDNTYADLSSLPLTGGKVGNINNLLVCTPHVYGQTGWLYELLAASHLAEQNLEKTQETPSEVRI